MGEAGEGVNLPPYFISHWKML